MCNIIPVQKHWEEAYEQSIICSNDIKFHKQLLLHNNIFTLMPQLTYQHLFKSKKLAAKPLQMKEKVEITHGILYRQDADQPVLSLIDLLEECMRRR